MNALLSKQARTWSDECQLRTWSVERAETIAAAGLALPDMWMELIDWSDQTWRVAELAELIRGAIDADEGWSAGRDWYVGDLVTWNRETDERDTSTERLPSAVPGVLETHKARNDGQIKGTRRGIRVGGSADRTADGKDVDPDVVAVVAGIVRDDATATAAYLLRAADALLGDDHALIGTDDYAWSEMTPPLSGDVRIDIDGSDHAHTVLSWRRDVIEELAARGAISRARAAAEQVTGEALREGLTQSAPRKPAYSVPPMSAPTKLDGRKAVRVPRGESHVMMVAGCPASLALIRVIQLPNVTTDGRMVITYAADGRRTIEDTRKHAERKHAEQKASDTARKATARAASPAALKKQAARIALESLATIGESVTLDDWSVTLVRPAEPTRKLAAILRADRDGQTVLCPPRKALTLVTS